MSRFTRAVAMAAAAVVAGGLVVAGSGPASAVVTPELTLSSYGPFDGGESVTVTWTGFSAGENVEITTCRKVATLGPTDCAPLGPGFADTARSKTAVSDGLGGGSATIEVVKGALGSTPERICGPGDSDAVGCNFVVTNFSGTKVAKYRVTYTATVSNPSPAGPYKGGENVAVNVAGAGANQSDVVLLLCDLDVPIGDGSQACDFGGMSPVAINASGSGTASIKVKRGALGNPLASQCSNATGQSCGIVATDFQGRLLGSLPLTYAQTMTLSPKAPYVGTENVTVSFAGFNANEPVSVSVCANRALSGPGDCADFGPGFTDGPSAKVATANANGAGSTTLKLVKGALGNDTAPAWTCGPLAGQGCLVVATSFDAQRIAFLPISYGSKQSATFPASVRRGTVKALPFKSAQGLRLTYRNGTPKVCTVLPVKRGKTVIGLRLFGRQLGTCRLVAANAGSAKYFAYAKRLAIAVKR